MLWGGRTPPHYRIEESIVTAIHAPVIQERAEDIFEAKDKSLGQRVGQGLGWMTSRSAKLPIAPNVYYIFLQQFEAILTSNDKNDPITQTISRYVSVILGREPASRSSIAGKSYAICTTYGQQLYMQGAERCYGTKSTSYKT